MTSVYDTYADILGDDLAQDRTPVHVECTDDCKARRVAWEIAIAEYTAKWTNYCRKCGATGEIGGWYDPSPAGVSLASGQMWDADPCSDCAEEGRCPRCGREVWTADDWDADEQPSCPECDWKWNEESAAPEQPECWCWEEHLP